MNNAKDNYRVIDKIENIKFDIIFVSGVQSIEKNKKGGGVYRLRGNFEKYNYKKLYSGNCHCIISNKQNEIYVSDVNEGIVKLDEYFVDIVDQLLKENERKLIPKNSYYLDLELELSDAFYKILNENIDAIVYRLVNK